MALAVKRDARMSVADFKRWAEPLPDDERWELLDGETVLMAPPKERHQMIVSNLIRRIGDLADGQDCRVLPGLAILSAAMDDFASVPGVVVRCGPPLPDGYADDPIVVVEVLSPSTMDRDRGRKTDFYRTVPSLKTFLIVYADEARVDVWRRDAVDWRVETLGPEGRVNLPELDGSVPLHDIYRGLTF